MIVGLLFVFVVLPFLVFISTPEGQKAIYAPTPTFQLIGIEDRLDLNVTPAPTDVYNPAGIVVGSNILKAWELIRQEEYVEAYEILEDEKLAYEAGYPYPYYLQSQIDLLANDDPEAARGKLEAGEAQFVNIPLDVAEKYYPMYNLGYGEVLFYEAREAQLDGRNADAEDKFDEAEERFQTAIQLDGRLTDAYIQLARLYVAQEEYDEAIATLNIPIEGDLSGEYYTNTLLRVERGRVYYAQGNYDRALQEANEAVFYDKYSEEAYILQAESALKLGFAGLANNYLDQFQLISR